MSEQTRHQLAQKLARQFCELDPERQIVAVREWKSTVEGLTEAVKRARRASSERARVAKNKGRERRPEMPGVSGRIFDAFHDFLYEGARVGAGRELTEGDAPRIVEAFNQLEPAVLQLAAGRRLRGVGMRAMTLHAVALGYWHLRGSFGSLANAIDLVDFVGKQKPAIEVAVLALAELGHSNAAITRGLDIDPSETRRRARSVRVS